MLNAAVFICHVSSVRRVVWEITQGFLSVHVVVFLVEKRALFSHEVLVLELLHEASLFTRFDTLDRVVYSFDLQLVLRDHFLVNL